MASDEKDSLQSLIAEILEAGNRGESVDREAMIGKHQDLAELLRDFLTMYDRTKPAADKEAPTLQRDESGLDISTIRLNETNREQTTIPPPLAGADPTAAVVRFMKHVSSSLNGGYGLYEISDLHEALHPLQHIVSEKLIGDIAWFSWEIELGEMEREELCSDFALLLSEILTAINSQ